MDQLDSLLPLSSKSSPPPINPNDNNIYYHSSPRTTSTTSTLSSSSPSTLLRFATILTLIGLSLWANYESTKGFDLTILSTSTQTLAGRRFNLLFVSNGRASQLALVSSFSIEKTLYTRKEFIRKPVHHVIISLAEQNFTERVAVRHCDGYLQKGKYLIELSQSLMMEKDVKMAVKTALYRGMAYVWVYENGPENIVDSMVDYLMIKSGFTWQHHKNATSAFSLANFIEFCEEKNNGFFARLNNAMAMQEKWSESSVSHALFSSQDDMMCLDRIVSMSETGVVANKLDVEINQSI